MFDINSNEGYFIHLIKCALKNEQPKEKPESVDFGAVYQLALTQNTENITWYSIEKLNNKPDQQLLHNWYQSYVKSVNKCATQQIELEFLTEALTSAGYDIMPLKGSVIRNYYPFPDMRTMTDIDLLVKSQDREPVRKIMSDCGYSLSLADDGQVDSFEKLPIMAVDVHYSLMADNHQFHEHFENTWSIANPTAQKGVYEMSIDDMYVYNIGHYAKHMFSHGTGIRCVIDSYVLWNSFDENIHKSICEKLENANLLTFNNQILKIAAIWFDNIADDQSVDNIQRYFINTPTYGTEDNSAIALMRSNDNSSKFKYFLKRVFPPVSYYYTRYNIKHKNPFLLPFLWIYRLFSTIFIRDRVAEEISNTAKLSKSDIDNNKSVFEELGLL